MTETSSSTGEDDPVAGVRVRVLDSAVGGDTSAEDGCSRLAVDAIGNGRNVCDIGNLLIAAAMSGDLIIGALDIDIPHIARTCRRP